MLTYELEQSLADEGFELVCGVDEAGRGPLCGPVAAAAVILPRGLVIEGLNDSKKLSELSETERSYKDTCDKITRYGGKSKGLYNSRHKKSRKKRDGNT